jgi:hypothetical protein
MDLQELDLTASNGRFAFFPLIQMGIQKYDRFYGIQHAGTELSICQWCLGAKPGRNRENEKELAQQTDIESAGYCTWE